MGQSLVKNYVHIIYSTKHGQALIANAIESELHSYLGGICNKLESFPVKIGGYWDHVHVLCMLSKEIALIKLIEELKAHSSKWIKRANERYNNFYWQDGYGAFSVSPSELEAVKHYIEKQHEHHKSRTFQEEFREILRIHNIDFDERFVWD
jgi:putative transposase